MFFTKKRLNSALDLKFSNFSLIVTDSCIWAGTNRERWSLWPTARPPTASCKWHEDEHFDESACMVYGTLWTCADILFFKLPSTASEIKFFKGKRWRGGEFIVRQFLQRQSISINGERSCMKFFWCTSNSRAVIDKDA